LVLGNGGRADSAEPQKDQDPVVDLGKGNRTKILKGVAPKFRKKGRGKKPEDTGAPPEKGFERRTT